MEEAIGVEHHLGSRIGELSTDNCPVNVGRSASAAATVEDRCGGDVTNIATPASDEFAPVCDEITSAENLAASTSALADATREEEDQTSAEALASFPQGGLCTRGRGRGRPLTLQAAAALGTTCVESCGASESDHAETVAASPQLRFGSSGGWQIGYTDPRVTSEKAMPSQSTERYAKRPVADSITEQPRMEVVAADGFIQYYRQEQVLDLIRRLREAFVEGYLDWHWAYVAVLRLNKLLLDVKRPQRRESLPRIDPLACNYAPISESTARHLTTKCDAVIKQAYLRVLTIEVVDGFCETLGALAQPIMDAFISGSVQCIRRLPEKTITMLPSDQQAVLSTAFHNIVQLYADNQLTTASFNDFCEVVSSAVESVGSPVQLVAPYHGATDLSESGRRGSLSRMFEAGGRIIIESFEAGTLTLNSLEAFVRHLNGMLNGKTTTQY